MNESGVPPKFPIPWANSAGSSYVRAIPTASQIGVTDDAASLTDGFPPLCFSPGGQPFGQDFNGILKQITQWLQWCQAGAPIQYDSTFQSAISGYPKNAVVWSATTAGVLWLSTVDANTTNPDTGGAGWRNISPNFRILLAANTTFYVSPSGNDSNSGLTSGSPWATIQHAVNVINAAYDLGGHTATISCADGTYTGTVTVSTPFTGGGSVVIQGDVATPANCIVSVTAANAFTVSNAVVYLQGFEIAATISGGAGGVGLQVSEGGTCFYQNIAWGACWNHVQAENGGYARMAGACSIVAGATYHGLAYGPGTIDLQNGAFTLTGTPAMSTTFLQAGGSGGVVTCQNMSFSGSGSGSGWIAEYGGFIDTNGTSGNITGAGFSAGTVSDSPDNRGNFS